MAKFTKEHRVNIGKASAATWARLSPEEKQTRCAKAKANQQRYKIKKGALPKHFLTSSAIVDEDFDEGFL